MIPKSLVSRFLEKLEKKVEITVYESKEMLEFVRELAELGDKISVNFVSKPEKTLGIPAIQINGKEIYFHAIPKHTELESFLTALKLVSKNKRDLNFNCEVLTFVSQFCPNCRMTADSINAIASRSYVKHHIIDVSMFPDFAEKFDIKSVPTAIIGEFRFVGAMNEDEAKFWIEKISEGDYIEYFTEKLQNGDIEEVKRIVIKKPELAKVLAKLMSHREFMIRLGSMAAIEALWKIDPKIVLSAKDEIIKLLKHNDERIREDAAMMLGIIGDTSDIEHLENAAKEGGRVSDSAEEAIGKIRRREDG